MSHIWAKSINIWLRYDPKGNLMQHNHQNLQIWSIILLWIHIGIIYFPLHDQIRLIIIQCLNVDTQLGIVIELDDKLSYIEWKIIKMSIVSSWIILEGSLLRHIKVIESKIIYHICNCMALDYLLSHISAEYCWILLKYGSLWFCRFCRFRFWQRDPQLSAGYAGKSRNRANLIGKADP